MNEELIGLFREWWVESYGVPPGPHAVMTHVGFAHWVLNRANRAEADVNRADRAAA